MNYLISIKTAIIVFPAVALLFTIPFILYQYHKYGAINLVRVLIIYSFILYLITIYFLVILPLPAKNQVVWKANMVKLIPFAFIFDFLKETSFLLNDPTTYLKFLTEPCFYTVLFNLFMTIPFGMYLRYYFKCDLKKTIILSFLLSLFFEVTQITGLYYIYPYPYRVFDIDDLIINTLGGATGYYLMGMINFLPSREEIDSESIKNSNIVSGFRRTTIFFWDYLLFTCISLFISLFIKVKYLLLILFIIYYILIPYLTNGYSIGSKFLNVRLEFKKYKLIKISLRIIFLFTYYFGIVIILINLILSIIKRLNLGFNINLWLYTFMVLIILIFYVINIFVLVINKKIFYDNLFKVKYVNTLKIKKE